MSVRFGNPQVVRKFSEFHEVRFVIVREREASMQVFLHISLDILVESAIDGFLGRNASLRNTGLDLYSFSEELAGTLVTTVALLTGKEFVLDSGDVDTRKVHGGGGGHGVHLVDALEWHSIHFVGSSNEEQA